MVIYVLLVHKMIYSHKDAGVAELADAPDLGSGVPDVQVQVLSPAFAFTFGLECAKLKVVSCSLETFCIQ